MKLLTYTLTVIFVLLANSGRTQTMKSLDDLMVKVPVDYPWANNGVLRNPSEFPTVIWFYERISVALVGCSDACSKVSNVVLHYAPTYGSSTDKLTVWPPADSSFGFISPWTAVEESADQEITIHFFISDQRIMIDFWGLQDAERLIRLPSEVSSLSESCFVGVLAIIEGARESGIDADSTIMPECFPEYLIQPLLEITKGKSEGSLPFDQEFEALMELRKKSLTEFYEALYTNLTNYIVQANESGHINWWIEPATSAMSGN